MLSHAHASLRCQVEVPEEEASPPMEHKSWPKKLMQSFRFGTDTPADEEEPSSASMMTKLKRATSKMWISGGGATSSKHIMINKDQGWFKDGSKVCPSQLHLGFCAMAGCRNDGRTTLMKE